MEFRDLKTQYMKNKEAVDSAIQRVLLGSHFIGGRAVEELEEILADYAGAKHCISCANGTDALLLALMAWNVGVGDAVFVPDFTFFSTAEVVPWVGATPIFVDVEEDTFNLSARALESAVQRVTEEGRLTPKVVIPVDLFGQPADFPAIREITEKYNLYLLEDGAQGFGGRIGERRACSFGDIATTSFFPAKPLGCYGDGGAVFTDNDEWAELIRSFKVHGKGKDKYDNVRIGMNSRLDTLQAVILLEKLKFFDNELECCEMAAGIYTKLLKDVVNTPVVMPNVRSAWAQYTVRFSDPQSRNRVVEGLKEQSIPSFVYYAKPLHSQKAFREQNVSENPVTCKLCETVLSLPMHPYLREENIDCIAGSIREMLSV